jgi:hypothetical protein
MVSIHIRPYRADCAHHLFPWYPGEHQIPMTDLNNLEIRPAEASDSGFDQYFTWPWLRARDICQAKRADLLNNNCFHSLPCLYESGRAG